VSAFDRVHLGGLVVTPFATIGVLAAVLVWEVEHVGSILIAVGIAAVAVAIGILVARQLRRDIAKLEDHYAALLRTADEQSRQAESASRLKDEFVLNLSHELRTPLNSILGWAKLLASGKLDAAQTARALRAIERAGWAQSHLIEDLLDLSRIVAGTMELSIRPTQLRPLVESAIESLGPAIDAKQLTLKTDIAPDLPSMALDPDRMKQVVWNLIANAVKFTPRGGAIQVTVSDGEQVRITVRDTGIGFPPEVAAHLFERFRQGDASTTREHGGLGLGLGIVRHVVELHGGRVFAHSGGENAGSTFEVRLPARPLAAPQDQPPALTPPQPTLRGVSVLVVDEDPQQLAFVRDTLELQGAVVTTATSPKEARARFHRHPPDVLVSDMVLNGDDGLSLIREIRSLDVKAGRTTPACALTALARTEDRRRALSAGFQVHVAKPAAPSELVKTVEWLARARVNELARRN
jgi:signal transduction histidine kinase/ActR/RegA family two-component response regulator